MDKEELRIAKRWFELLKRHNKIDKEEEIALRCIEIVERLPDREGIAEIINKEPLPKEGKKWEWANKLALAIEERIGK